MLETLAESMASLLYTEASEAEKAEELLPDGYVHVTITPEENGSRTVRIE